MLVELRLCHIRRGRRAQWLRFFEQQLMPFHRSVGIGRLLGHFLSYRDDRGFVWLHAFHSQGEREQARARLWDGPQWRELSATALTLLEQIRVHVLAPLPGSPVLDVDQIPAAGPLEPDTGVLEIRISRTRSGRRAEFAEFSASRAATPEEAAGMRVLGQFADIEDNECFVWFRGFPDIATRDRHTAWLPGGDAWDPAAGPEGGADDRDVWLVAPVRGAGRRGAQ